MQTPAEMSREAFASIEDQLPRLQAEIFSVIRTRGALGATCDEIEVITGLAHQTASARVHEMMIKGRIVSAGKRKTRSGRNAVVWVVPPVAKTFFLNERHEL